MSAMTAAMYTVRMPEMPDVPAELSVAEARNRLSGIIEKSRYFGGRTFLTNHGRRAAAVVSVEDVALLKAIEARPKLLACVREAAEADAAES